MCTHRESISLPGRASLGEPCGVQRCLLHVPTPWEAVCPGLQAALGIDDINMTLVVRAG